MYLVSVDFSINNLLTEQLNVRSFYDLPILNTILLKLQLLNFADSEITKAYILNGENMVDFSMYEIENINLEDFYKAIFKMNKNESIVFFRNDVYFENDASLYQQYMSDESALAFCDNYGNCYCVITSVSNFRKIYNKNHTLNEIFQNSEKFADVHLTPDCYINELNSVKKYKALLFDILDGKTAFKPPRVAEGIFTNDSVPTGDFSIIPPVFFGETVQIESGSIIGPNVIVYNKTLISENTSIKNSVLFDNVYVSSNCYIDGAVCCENSSIKRNSAVFSGSVIGANALIGEDMLVENNSLINKNVKYSNFIKSPFTNKFDNCLENKFQGLSPDKAALLGSAIATVFNRPRIVIANDGSPNSTAVKLALLSGLIASGAECFDIGTTFKTHVFFALSFCECEYSVFINGETGGTNIEIFNLQNENLSKTDCYNLFNFCYKNEFRYVDKIYCKNVRQIRGLKKMYVREITSLFDCDLNFNPIIRCKNEMILKTLNEIFCKLTNNEQTREKIYININLTGTKVRIKYKDEWYNEKELQKLVHFYYKKFGENYFSQNIYYSKLWKKDVFFLIFSVFYIVEKTGKNISELISSLPGFFISSKSYKTNLKSGDMAKKIGGLKPTSCKKGFYNIPLKHGIIKVSEKSDSDTVKLLCASDNMAFSDELCEFMRDYLSLYET